MGNHHVANLVRLLGKPQSHQHPGNSVYEQQLQSWEVVAAANFRAWSRAQMLRTAKWRGHAAAWLWPGRKPPGSSNSAENIFIAIIMPF